MLLRRKSPLAKLAISLVLCVSAAAAAAQVPSKQQSAICQLHNQNDATCRSLLYQFVSKQPDWQAMYKSGVWTTPFTSLDGILGDTKAAVSQELGPRALELAITSALKTQGSQALQAALQTVSTGAAVTQVGASPTAGGSTNLVSKPTITDLISLASESGAFTDTSNGSSMTVQTNALGLAKFMTNTPVFQRISSSAADWIQPLNFTVTLNVAQASVNSTATTGTANSATPTTIAAVLIPSNNASFSSFAASYTLYRPYSPQSKTFQGNWQTALKSNQAALDTATLAIASAMDKLAPADLVQKMSDMQPQIIAWHKAGAAAVDANDFNAFAAAYATYEDSMVSEILSGDNAVANVLSLNQAIEAFNAATYTVLDQARGKPLATFSYNYGAAGQMPATHAFTEAVAYVFKGKPNEQTGKGSFGSGAQFTTNFISTIYATVPVGAAYGRLRDLQVSSEFDLPVGGTIAAPRVTFSAAGYGQYQYSPTVLNITSGNLAPGTNITLPSNAQVLLGTSGWLGVVQGKAVINISKTLSVPLAIKWSNRTELLQANDIRGQFGLCYDLSALSSLISGSK
jgi:hypothetical protein